MSEPAIYQILARCREGHTQTIEYQGIPRRFVENQAGLMDGSSELFKFRPMPGRGEPGTIGKCGICGSQITCQVKEIPTPPREILTHKVNGLNDALTIVALDEPGPGGANHQYEISYVYPGGCKITTSITFQNGPLKEAGVNGISNEALLAIVADRLQSFQAGPFAATANGAALNFINAALGTLQERTIERVARGVEGELKP
jgi:hypothetical protein